MIMINSREAAERLSMTEEQIANLIALAKALREVPPPKFDMREYFVHRYSTHSRAGYAAIVGKEDYVDHNECGTCCCALGLGAFRGIGAPGPDEGFSSYAERVFGVEQRQHEWNWMFGPEWGGGGELMDINNAPDNTPEGAALRIEWLLEKGLPENHRAMRLGREPLCYGREA